MVAIDVSALHETFQSPLSSYWDGTYGGADAVGGYGRVPCEHSGGTPAPAALLSTTPGGANTWSMSGSSIYVEVPAVPVAGGATVAGCRMAVLSETAGTYLSVAYNAVSGSLELGNYTGGTDTGLVTVAYSATVHRWWRIRHATGRVYYDTSPDGMTWTVRRTVAGAPSWVQNDDVQVELYAARDGGTNDYADFDNVNALSATPAPGAVAGSAAVPTPDVITVDGNAYAYPAVVPVVSSVPAPTARAGSSPSVAAVVATVSIPVPQLVTTDPVLRPIPGRIAICPGLAEFVALPTAVMPVVSGSVTSRTLSGTAVVTRTLSGSVRLV